MNNNYSNLTILYVEDEELIRKNAVEYLSRKCKEVYDAKDGVEALKVYRDKKPDIIISDINMPKLNGLDMAKKIRQNDRKTPIIIATAYTDTTYLIKAVELQLVKYLVKPITSAKLQEALFLATQHLELNNIIQIEKSKLYDTLNKTLIIDDAVIKLSKNELLLLDILAKNHQRAITYQEIENYVWSESAMSIDALRSLVRAVRKKLQGDYVENISGIGYRLMIL